MPIKPENRQRYPVDWPEIRATILERAGRQCEHEGCAARHYAIGEWRQSSAGWTWLEAEPPAESYGQARQRAADWSFAMYGDDPAAPKVIVIVLTIAHLNHEPSDCRPENLAAMCQRHHLAYDQQHHNETAYATRMAKRGNMELPLC